MPQGLTTPNWYNDDTYIKDKVAECNVIRFGDAEQLPWDAESVRSFLAAANDAADYQPWMGYDNFVSNGNAENCSPNPLFNVMEYLTAKANQLNTMNDGAGYEGNNAWTAQNVLDYFKAHNITAWDHFTTAGQFEGINPSNAMDLSDFLTRKAAQCNAEAFDDKTDWTPESVLDYYKTNKINAVQVAVNASDPNVVAVPADEAVTVPAGETPWGLPQLNTVNLEVGKADVVDDGGMPTNFVGTVETSNAKSSFNPDDQITGTTDGDILTVTMNSGFSGMNKGGFVKGVSTVDLTNGTTGDLTFNANGIEGASTYNIKGNIGLDNLDATGLTVNLSNVNTSQGLTIDYAPNVTAGPSDAMTLGLSNVYQPSTNTDQPSKAVDINSTGIEDVTVNSTGPVTNIVNLEGVNYMRSLTVEGNTGLRVTGVDAPLKTIDASKAEASVNINATGASQITGIKLGEGNDTVTVTNILPSATIDGGAGDDNLVMANTSGTFNYVMNDVEKITIQNNTGAVTLNGADVDDLGNLGINGASSNIIMTNFADSDLKIQAVNGNTANYTNADVTNVSIRVGDGDETTTDAWAPADTNSPAPNISLGQAATLNIDATDTIDQGARFIAEVDADKVSNLNLNAGTKSDVVITSGSDLNNVTQIDATGTGNIVIAQGSVVGVDSKQLLVNTTQMDAGDFTASFGNHTAGNGSIDIQGSGMTDNVITIDNTYQNINMNTGMGADRLILNAGNADEAGNVWTAGNLKGNLGADTQDVVVVHGDPYKMVDGQQVWYDFSGLKGVERIIFTDFDAKNNGWMADQSTLVANTVKVAEGTTVVWDPTYNENLSGAFLDKSTPGTIYDDTFNIGINPDARGLAEFGGAGGTDTFQGYIASRNSDVVLKGGKGAVDVDFGPNQQTQLNVQLAHNLTVTGGEAPNTVEGNVANVTGVFALDNTANTHGGDFVYLSNVQAQGNVSVKGATGTAQNDAATYNTFDVTVTQADDVLINAGDAIANQHNLNGSNYNAGAYVDIDGGNTNAITGDVNVTTGQFDDAVHLANLTAATAANPKAFALNMDGGNDVLYVDGNVNLSGWTNGAATGQAAIQGVETVDIAQGVTLNLGSNVTFAKAGPNGTDQVDVIGEGSIVTTNAANQLGNLDLSGFTGSARINATTAGTITLNNNVDDTVVLGSGTATAPTAVTIANFDVDNDVIAFGGYLASIDGLGQAQNAVQPAFNVQAMFSSNIVTSADGANVTVDNASAGKIGVSDANWASGTASLSGVSLDDALADDNLYILTDAQASVASAVAALFVDNPSISFTADATYSGSDANGHWTVGLNKASAQLSGMYLDSGDDGVFAIQNGNDTNLWYINNNNPNGAAGIDATEVHLIGVLAGVKASDLDASNFSFAS